MVRLASAVVVLIGCVGVVCGPAALAATTPVTSSTEPVVTTAPPIPTVPATTPVATTPDEVVPVAPSTEAPTPTAPDQPVTTGGNANSAVLWIVLGLAALVVIGIVIWLVTTSTRRSDLVVAWQVRRRAAYAEGAALHDAIVSASGQLGRLTPADEARRWADVERRADDFTLRLYQLRETAPDETVAARTDDVLVSLQSLRSAVDAERTAGIQAGMTAEVTRARLGEFRAALHALRAD